MTNLESRDRGNPPHCRFVEELDGFVPDLVLTVDLFDDQFGVRENFQLRATRERREAQGDQQRSVFRVVVRSCSKVFGNLRNSWKVNSGARLPGITAGAAVDIGFQLHATS